MFLRQSTTQVVLFGPCLDKTDGVAEEVSLTLAQADMRLSKDGGAFAQKSAAGNATHDSDGWYSTTLSTTDTDTVGELRLNVHQPANMLPLWDRWWVLEEAVYDEIFGAAAPSPATAVAVAAVKVDTAAVLVDTADIQPKIGSPAADLAADVAAVKVDTAAVLVDTADMQPKLGTPAADLAADIAAIVDEVWDELLTGGTHNIATSAGRRLRQIEAAFVVDSGTAQAGSSTTITLAATASASDEIYRGDRVTIIAGTGQGEHDIITAYNGTTKVATVAETWIITPDATSEYELSPASVDVETWQHQVAAVTGALPNMNVESVDTDAIDAAALAADAVQEIADKVLPKKNTAFSDIHVYMVLTSDHVSASTGLTLGVTRSIDGGAFGAGTGTAAEIGNGSYQYDASQADMNGDIITFRFTGTSSDDTYITVRTGG